MDIVRIAAAGMITAVLAITLRKQAPEFALAVSIAGSVIIFFMVLPKLAAVMEVLSHLTERIDADASYVYIVMKIIGVAYIAEFGAQICEDAGETAIASKIELGGKAIIMFMSAPVLLSLVDMIDALLPS